MSCMGVMEGPPWRLFNEGHGSWQIPMHVILFDGHAAWVVEKKSIM